MAFSRNMRHAQYAWPMCAWRLFLLLRHLLDEACSTRTMRGLCVKDRSAYLSSIRLLIISTHTHVLVEQIIWHTKSSDASLIF